MREKYIWNKITYSINITYKIKKKKSIITWERLDNMVLKKVE